MALTLIIIFNFIYFCWLRLWKKEDVSLWNVITLAVLNRYTKISDNRLVAIAIYAIWAFIGSYALGMSLVNATIAYNNSQSILISFFLQWGDINPALIYVCIAATVIIVAVRIIFGNHVDEEHAQEQHEIKEKVDHGLSNQQLLIGKIDFNTSILERLESKLNMDFSKLLYSTQTAINELKLKTALEFVNSIDNTLTSNGGMTPALAYRIHYLQALCLRYTNKDETERHYTEAYNKMHDTNEINVEVIAAYLRMQVRNGNKEHAKRIALELQAAPTFNVWSLIPDIIYADDIEAALSHAIESRPGIEEELLSEISYSGLSHDVQEVMIKRALDYYNGNVEPLNTLSFHNQNIWYLRLSVSLNLFFQNWFILFGKALQTEYTELLRIISKSYLEKEKETELQGIVYDLSSFYHYTSYCNDHNQSHIEELREATFSEQNKETLTLCLASMLVDSKQTQEALTLLKEYNEATFNMFNYRVAIAELDNNIDEIEEVIKEVAESELEIPTSGAGLYFSKIANLFGRLKNLAPRLHMKELVVQQAYNQLLCFLENKSNDIDWLKENAQNLPAEIIPMMSFVYNKCFGLDIAIFLLQPHIRVDMVSPATSAYLQLVQTETSYRQEAYGLLQSLINNGVELFESHLLYALHCANINGDFEYIIRLCDKLIEMNPSNSSYYVTRLSALFHAGNLEDEMISMKPSFLTRTFSDDATARIANLYAAIGEFQFAIDFIYERYQNTHSQALLDFYVKQGLLSGFSSIINSEVESVRLGDYVTYEESGEQHSQIVQKDSTLADLVGLKRGEEKTTQVFGKSFRRKVIDIQTKYYKLYVEGQMSIHNNESSSFVSIKADEEFMKNPIEFLKSLTGETEEKRKHREQALQRYAEGDLSLFNFIHGSTFSDLYSKLFGDFKIFTVHPLLMSMAYIQYGMVNTDTRYVLDVTSLFVLEELDCRFKLKYPDKFLLPKSLKNHLEFEIKIRNITMPNYLIDKVTVRSTGDDRYYLKLKQVLDWIEKHCEIKETPSVMNFDVSKLDNEEMLMELPSIMLNTENNNTKLLTEDIGMFRLTPSATVGMWIWLTNNDLFKDIFKFLGSCNYKHLEKAHD